MKLEGFIPLIWSYQDSVDSRSSIRSGGRRNSQRTTTARPSCAATRRLHFHDLRREAGSQMLEAGNAIHDVRDALGHSNVTMTNAYLSTTTERLQKAFKRHAQHRARKRIRLVASAVR